MAHMSNFTVTVNLPGDEHLEISAEGVSSVTGAVGGFENWFMPLEQAKAVFDSALRSVHTFLEVEGSGARLTSAPRTDGEVTGDTSSERQGGDAPSSSFSSSRDCVCGLTSPCRCNG